MLGRATRRPGRAGRSRRRHHGRRHRWRPHRRHDSERQPGGLVCASRSARPNRAPQTTAVARSSRCRCPGTDVSLVLPGGVVALSRTAVSGVGSRRPRVGGTAARGHRDSGCTSRSSASNEAPDLSLAPVPSVRIAGTGDEDHIRGRAPPWPFQAGSRATAGTPSEPSTPTTTPGWPASTRRHDRASRQRRAGAGRGPKTSRVRDRSRRREVAVGGRG